MRSKPPMHLLNNKVFSWNELHWESGKRDWGSKPRPDIFLGDLNEKIL